MFLVVIGAIFVVLVGITAYYGAFYSVDVQVKQTGGETIVYEKMKGDYSLSKAVMDKIYEKLQADYQIESTQGIGIYYDNPRDVPTAELRFDVGCVLPDGVIDRLEDLKAEFLVKTLEEREYLEAEFPFRGGPSVFLNIMKTYPALQRFAEVNDYNQEAPIIEIYDVPNKKIIVRMEATLMRS